MKDRIKKFAPGAALCIGELTVGILLLIDPAWFTAGIITVVGWLLALMGIWTTAGYFRTPAVQAAREQKLARGLCIMALGLFCAFGSGWFIATFTALAVLYGVAMLLLGIMRVQMTVDAIRQRTGRWLWAGIGAAVTLVCAGIILINPFAATQALWVFAGISLIAEAAVDAAAVTLGWRASRHNGI